MLWAVEIWTGRSRFPCTLEPVRDSYLKHSITFLYEVMHKKMVLCGTLQLSICYRILYSTALSKVLRHLVALVVLVI